MRVMSGAVISIDAFITVAMASTEPISTRRRRPNRTPMASRLGQNRPDQVELLLDGQRPQVGDARTAHRDRQVAGVGDADEQAPAEVCVVALRVEIQRDHVQSTQHEHQRGHESQRAIAIETDVPHAP